MDKDTQNYLQAFDTLRNELNSLVSLNEAQVIETEFRKLEAKLRTDKDVADFVDTAIVDIVSKRPAIKERLDELVRRQSGGLSYQPSPGYRSIPVEPGPRMICSRDSKCYDRKSNKKGRKTCPHCGAALIKV